MTDDYPLPPVIANTDEPPQRGGAIIGIFCGLFGLVIVLAVIAVYAAVIVEAVQP